MAGFLIFENTAYSQHPKDVLESVYGLDESEYMLSFNENTCTAEIFSDSPSNAKTLLHVPAGYMQAFLTLYPELNGGEKLTADGLRDRLIYVLKLKKELISGEQIEFCAVRASEGKVSENILIASGIHPLDGMDGILEQCYAEPPAVPEEDERGRVNYHRLSRIIQVKEGEKLFSLIPPSEGTDGMNVYGGRLPSLKGVAAAIVCGSNVIHYAERQGLFSGIDGHVLYDGKKVEVSEAYLVKGNLDFSTGSVSFTGTVHVRGEALPGFFIKAKNIRIDGLCRAEALEAEEDILVTTGINAAKSVKCGGSLRAGFLENTCVEAGGDIDIMNYSYNSILLSGGEVRALSREGKISGGSVTAFSGVRAKVIGGGNSGFSIQAGVKYFLEKEVKRMMNQREHLRHKLMDTDARIKKLAAKNNRLHENPKLKSIIAARGIMLKKYEELRNSIDMLLRESMHPNPEIVATRTISEGVRIRLYGTEAVLSESMEKVRFYFSKEEKQIENKEID